MKTKIVNALVGLFNIETDEEISDESKKAMREVAGVEDVLAGRYWAQIKMGKLFIPAAVQDECQRILKAQRVGVE